MAEYQPNIVNTAKLVSNNWVKILVYGESASGKTTLGATAPNPIFFNCEPGLLSIKDFSVDSISIKSFDDFTKNFIWLTTDPKAKKYQTLVLDSLSDLCERELESRIPKEADPRKAYNKVQQKTFQLLRYLRDNTNLNVLVICKQDHIKDESNGTIYYGPSLPGQKSQIGLAYLFDEVFHMTMIQNTTTGKYDHWVRTQRDLQYVAKDNSNRLEPWEHPNLTDIISKIRSNQRSA